MTEPAQLMNRQQALDQGDDEPLGSFQRGLAGLLGLVSGGAGAVATFLDGSNVGGAPLLIGVGAVFGYLALTGQRITRFEAGGAKAELARTRRAIEMVIVDPDVPEQAKAEIAEAVRDERLALSRDARRVVDAVLDNRDAALNYEHAAMEAIHRVRPDLVAHFTGLRSPADVVLSNNLQKLPVTIKATRSLNKSWRELFPIFDALRGVDLQHLLIVDEDIRPMIAEALQFFADRLLLVVWSEPSQDGKLRAKLDEVFGPAPAL